ncbi:Pseudouridine-metabolizing bifunctional protein [Acipenser ruthenus]|uniref:Pseudouridine-metabolizing bifunctional protein n=1 Tax=Acipenser ruthenus TaxID=7906 RepID=A0A444U1U9_ACIRT|nr:Pseudouridine-metabolizing bifunctional protein [Acipenser ruthenus]
MPGSLWEPNIAFFTYGLEATVQLDTGDHSERYKVVLESCYESTICNTKSQEITKIQPYFVGCSNDCVRQKKVFNTCKVILSALEPGSPDPSDPPQKLYYLIPLLGLLGAGFVGCCVITWKRNKTTGSLLRIHPSVSEALASQEPVVALESTIITHGMPYPHNLRTAQEVEGIVRASGATPATVGVLGGRVHVGLSEEELCFLARSEAPLKVSRRDLPYALSQGLSGGTTVSATMTAAHRAGIPVFVTGGVGGVHRGGESTMDVSADLTELGRTPVAVVSAGVKSILDIGRTLEYLVCKRVSEMRDALEYLVGKRVSEMRDALEYLVGKRVSEMRDALEYLETQGVCVATFGSSRDFPAFFAPRSGFVSPYNVKDEREAAALIASALALGLGSGVLIAVPIPEEQAAVGQEIEEAIQRALTESREKGITGREVTPFVLKRVSELTQGKSLEAMVGSGIARALVTLRQEGQTPSMRRERQTDQASAVVIGGINVDFIAKVKQEKLVMGQTNPGSVGQSFGGVGRNLADCLTRLGVQPLFISALGVDALSESALSYCTHMNTSGVARLQDHSTATYCAVITEKGELGVGVSRFEERLATASLVCLDGNIPVSTIDYVCGIASKHRVPVVPSSLDDVLGSALALSRPLLEHLRCVVVTLGPHGVLLCGDAEGGAVSLQGAEYKHQPGGRLCGVHYPAIPISAGDIVNVSGAGDSISMATECGPGGAQKLSRAARSPRMCPGLLSNPRCRPVTSDESDSCGQQPPHSLPNQELLYNGSVSLAAGLMAGMLQGQDSDTCVKMGLLAADMSLRSHDPVSPALSSTTVSLEQVRARCWPPVTWQWPG